MEEFCLKKSIFYVDFFLVLFEPVNGYKKKTFRQGPTAPAKIPTEKAAPPYPVWGLVIYDLSNDPNIAVFSDH